MTCKQCNFLHNQWCERVWDSPDEELERDCRYFRQKTNGDRIRAMADEELANLLTAAAEEGGNWSTEDGRYFFYSKCLEMLRQPVKEVSDG